MSEVKEEADIPTADPFEEQKTASSQIRDEARKMIPALVAEGKDPASKDVYPAVVNSLAERFGVNYNTAKKAWDRVLKETGETSSKPEVVTSEKTVGSVKAKVRSVPKVITQEMQQQSAQPSGEQTELVACPKCGAKAAQGIKFCPKCGQVLAEKASVNLSPEQLDEALGDMIEFPTKMLYKFAETAWKVKIEDGPDEEDFQKIGKEWGDVIRAYGIDIPKFMLVVIAGATTVSTIALPVMLARGEYMEREKKKAADEAAVKKRTQFPELPVVVSAVPAETKEGVRYETKEGVR